MRNLVSLGLFLSVLCVVGGSRKVLILFPFPGTSHNILGVALARGLARAGFDVTFVTPIELKKDVPKNLRVIEMRNLYEAVHKRKSNFLNVFEWERSSPILQTLAIYSMSSSIGEYIFKDPSVQYLLTSKNETFDVVIAEQFLFESLHVFGRRFHAPVIILSSLGPNKWINNLVGNPEPSSYVPEVFFGYGPHMGFFERTYNFIFGVAHQLVLNFLIYPAQANLVKKYCPDELSLDKYMYNASLILMNSHESLHQAMPQVPNMISIGGYHVNPPKELPADLKQFMDNAKEGVMYFSLGSLIQPSLMPSETRQAILKVLGARKEKILWKWNEDSLSDKPDNVKISKWFPQQDILAHPNCKLFITHCGLLSLTEAVYHGVPLLGFPVFADQKLNAAQMENLALGKSLAFSAITEEELRKQLSEVMDNPKYLNNAKFRSKLFHDRPMKPMDLAAYWVDYVIRYRGAPHLRVAGVDLPLYKYLMLDVIAVILLSISFFFYLVTKLLQLLISSKPKLKQN